MTTTQYPDRANHNRPDYESKISIRCPRLMKQIVRDYATINDTSETEEVLSALEERYARLATHREDFYGRPASTIVRQQQQRLSHSLVLSQR